MNKHTRGTLRLVTLTDSISNAGRHSKVAVMPYLSTHQSLSSIDVMRSDCSTRLAPCRHAPACLTLTCCLPCPSHSRLPSHTHHYDADDEYPQQQHTHQPPVTLLLLLLHSDVALQLEAALLLLQPRGALGLLSFELGW